MRASAALGGGHLRNAQRTDADGQAQAPTRDAGAGLVTPLRLAAEQ